MKNFLYKEIKFCLVPINYLFLLFSTMICIPNYPRYIPFFYFCLSIFFVFSYAELNKDITYSMILPIQKKEIVKSRCILIFVYEFVGILLTIPFALLGNKIMPNGNQAGIDGNFAFYGLALICITVFNFMFFTSFYKRGEKPEKAFRMASIVFWILFIIFEFPFWLNHVLKYDLINRFDSTKSEDLFFQLPILFFGIIFFIVGWFLTYKKASQSFEKVDL